MSLTKKVYLTISGYDIKLSDNLTFYQKDQLKLIFYINEYGIDYENNATARALMPVNPLNAILFIENPDGVDSVSSAKIEDNAVTFYLDSTHTQYVGVSRMQLRLFDQDGCAITLPHFTFEIRENIYGSGDVRFQNVVMVDQTGTVILTEDNDLLDVGDILTMGTEVAYPQVTKTIKELPIKHGLDGTEKLIVEDNEATKQASLGTIVDEIKQNSQEKIREIESELAQTNAQLSTKNNLLIEDYNQYANGDDYSNVIKYIMDNVVDETKRTVINFQAGKDYIINAKINKRNVTLTGEANIIGLLEVGLDDLTQNDTNNPWYDTMMHCIIDGLSFIPSMNFASWGNYDEYGIRLFNARSVTIRNCYFANMRFPIYFKKNRGEWIHQHTHRVRVLNCTFMCVGYNLYCEDYDSERTTSQYLEYGDIDFQGNFCEETKIANIKMCAMDGFTCFNNTFFLEKNQGNIDIYYTPGIHISNNRIFEPGTTAINIYKTQDLVITGNHIYNSGFRNHESAIKIEVGMWFDKDYGICGVISNNIFRKCQGHAIEIVNSVDNYGATNYIITGNYMNIEADGYTPIKSIGYSQGAVISNNISNRAIDVKSAKYAIANNNAQTDRPGAHSNDNTWTQWNSSNGDVIMNLQHLGSNQYLIDSTALEARLTIAEPLDKSLLTNFMMLVVESQYGNTILKNTSFIRSASKDDLLLGSGEKAVFMYIDGAYHQI